MADFPSRIVCVEDESEISALLKATMQISERKFVFVTCSSGNEIISRFNELQPDLMFLDLSLPDMTGPDVLEAVRDRMVDYSTRVLVVTGHNRVVMNDEYRKLGVVDVVHKPFEPEALLDKVTEIFEQPFDAGALVA